MTAQKPPLSVKKALLFKLLLLLLPIIVISGLYLGYAYYTTDALYDYVKNNNRGFSGRVHAYDRELGFAQVPNSTGAHLIPESPDIPIKIDKWGLRVPVDDSFVPGREHPTALLLGDSFTHGDSEYAENAYPYVLGTLIDAPVMNAGVCAYGLSQMLILAKRLLASGQKPDYLVVQYSHWLVGRSFNRFAPMLHIKLPTPYFSSDGSRFVLSLPVYKQIVMSLPFDRYKESKKSATNKLSFYFRVSLPLSLHRDINMIALKIKDIIGITPPVAIAEPLSYQKVEGFIRYFYKEMARLAEDKNARLVIVVLGNDEKPIHMPAGVFPKGAIVVNGHNAILQQEDIKTQSDYVIKALNDDWHPNATAHRIIAEEIASKIVDDWNRGRQDEISLM